jgi:protein gp37
MLNKQGPGKIDWTDYSWNAISGRCLHNCQYCYMHRYWKLYPAMAKLQLKENYLKDNFPKKPSKIFVGSSTDMWGEWVPDEWVEKVLKKVKENPHIFQFLTKNPERYRGFFTNQPNCWYGTTVDGTDFTIGNIKKLLNSTKGAIVRFASFEPLISPLDRIDYTNIYLLDWVIIGADSSKSAKKPPMEWASSIIDSAKKFNIPVWVKDNYGYPEVIKEFPK